jgi:hypothetical protein
MQKAYRFLSASRLQCLFASSKIIWIDVSASIGADAVPRLPLPSQSNIRAFLVVPDPVVQPPLLPTTEAAGRTACFPSSLLHIITITDPQYP